MKHAKSYNLSREIISLLTNKKGDFLKPNQFNKRIMNSFGLKATELLTVLYKQCKPYEDKEDGSSEVLDAEAYYFNSIRNLDITNWHTILERICGDLDYYSDRWCYSRYITIRRLIVLFLIEWEKHKKWRNFTFADNGTGHFIKKKINNIPLYGVGFNKEIRQKL